MKRLLLAASLASLLLTTTVALADGHHHRGDDRHHHDRDDDDDDDGYYREHWKHHDYHRGERIEVVYLQPRYYVDDYREYRLAPPPPGHRWIRDPDGRFILVAVATGIIADILLNH